MTDDEQAEWDLLKMANAKGKFAVGIGADNQRLGQALERLLVRRWVTLIDVSPIKFDPGRLYRIFLATDEAMIWFRRSRS
jgi:hypothetical protein